MTARLPQPGGDNDAWGQLLNDFLSVSHDATGGIKSDVSTQRIEVAKAGTVTGTRKQLNLIEGANVAITTADNSGSNRVDVTIAASPAPIENVNTVAASGSATTLPGVTTATINVVTLTANCTLTFPAAGAGRSFTLVVQQDATGGRSITWPGSVKWPGGAAPTLTSAANAIDYIMFLSPGTTWHGFPAGSDVK